MPLAPYAIDGKVVKAMVMDAASDLGSSAVRFSATGDLGAVARSRLANLETTKTVSSSGTTQSPGFVAVRQGGKTVVTPSTRPQPPPTFQPTDDHSSIIKLPYVGPVYYTKAGGLSRPIQDLGHGALVNIVT